LRGFGRRASRPPSDSCRSVGVRRHVSAGRDTYRYDPMDPVPTLNLFFDKSIVTDQKPVADVSLPMVAN